MQMQVTLVSLRGDRPALAVQLIADEDPNAYNEFEMFGELESYPRAGGWRRLVPLRHLLAWGQDENPTVTVPIVEMCDVQVGQVDLGLRLAPGRNPPPFLVDVTDVPRGRYLLTIGRRSVLVDITELSPESSFDNGVM